MKNTPKIQEKFSETFWNMSNPNKVFRAHDKIIWSIEKLDYIRGKVRISSGRSRKNSHKVLRDMLMDDKPKRNDWSRRKEPWESPNDKVRIRRARI